MKILFKVEVNIEESMLKGNYTAADPITDI